MTQNVSTNPRIYRAKFKPASAKRKINRFGRIVDESDTMYYFRETDENGIDKVKNDNRRGRVINRFFMAVKSDVELVGA